MNLQNNVFIGTRDERQKLCVQKWLRSNGKGTLIQPTGCGKTTTALKCITTALKKYTDFKVLVVVPTTNLKEQWEEKLPDWNLTNNVSVKVINTVILHDWTTDILVLDEIHTTAAETFKQVFEKVKYHFVLGLTATFERLDGKHEIIAKYCPIVDEITLGEATINNWLAKSIEYEVLLDVDDIDEYRTINKEFIQHFEFFNFDWNLVFSLTGKDGFVNRKAYTTKICTNKDLWNDLFKQVTYHAMGFMRTMQAKKSFINNHPKKIEIAKHIIEMRPDSKIITFSGNIKMAEAIGGPVYSGKDTKKKGRITMDEFILQKKGVLNSIAKLNAGADIPGLSVAIVLGLDSSKIKSIQRAGRVKRKEGDKKAEIFNLIINDTQELKWFDSSHQGIPIVKIDVDNLEKVLNYQPYETYKRPLSKFNYRF